MNKEKIKEMVKKNKNMKIDKNVPIPSNNNQLHETILQMEEGNSIVLLIEDYPDRKSILQDVRQFNSTHNKNVKVRLAVEETGHRLWVESNKKKPRNSLSNRDREIINEVAKNEVNRLEKKYGKKIEKLEKEVTRLKGQEAVS